MDPEVKTLLEENLRLSKENNELLLKIRNVQRWQQITRIIYWLIIIGISFGAFYFLKPYLGSFVSVYSGGVTNINSTKGYGNSLDLSEIQQLIKDLNS